MIHIISVFYESITTDITYRFLLIKYKNIYKRFFLKDKYNITNT